MSEKLMEVSKVNITLQETSNTLDTLLEAISGHDKDMLLKKADFLKGTDGEGWAIGELVERAVKIISD